MGEPKESRDDEHIEELLSQLQGIFGKLSNAEEEEAREKVDLPAKSETPAKIEAPTPPRASPPETPDPEPAPAPPIVEQAPAEPPVPSEPAPPIQETAPEPVPETTVPAPVAEQSALEASAITPEMMADKSVIFSVVCYPTGRDNEVKILGQKLETMAPKFTKVAFQLKVAAFVPYNPKSDWQEAVLSKATEGAIRAVFIMVDRPMDDPRRKAMAAALESRGIYFQEVPITSVEKKALYTDLLLGMVFFFDSLKQSGPDAAG